MRHLKFLPFIAFFTFICWIIFLADIDQENVIMQMGHQVKYGDKIGHLMLYGIMAWLLNMALAFRKIPTRNLQVLLGSVMVLAFATLEEFTQLAFESRTFDWMDILFDVLGVGMASFIPKVHSFYTWKLAQGS